MDSNKSYYCTSCNSVQAIDGFHFCPKENVIITIVEADQRHPEVRCIGEDIGLGEIMSQEIDMHGSGFDPATGKSRPWHRALASDAESDRKATLVAWRNFKKGEEVNSKFFNKKIEIPIADEDPTYHALNTIRSNLLSIATLIENDCFYRAHHETLMLEKYVREIQRSGSAAETL